MWSSSSIACAILVIFAAQGQSSAFTSASISSSSLSTTTSVGRTTSSSQSSSIRHQYATKETASTTTSADVADTPEVLPEFPKAEEYVQYLKTVSALPKGFATGTADGKFISVEAPALGQLPIRATVIQLTDGPTDNWAACFTSNKVSGLFYILLDHFSFSVCHLSNH